MLKKSTVLFLVLFTAAYSSALTEDELNRMLPEKAKKLPVADVWPVIMKDGEKLMWFMVEHCLLDLRYYFNKPAGVPSNELKAAIREFQADIGHPPTGNLLMGEFEEIQKRHQKIEPMSIYVGSSKNIIKSEDSVLAKGTWVFEGDAIADPVQITEIFCQRQSRSCSMTTARLSLPGDTSSDGSAYLYLDTDDFSVTKWTENEVVAENDSSLCVAYTLSINSQKNEASMFRRAKGKGCDGISEAPQIMKLVDGFKHIFDFWSDRNRKINEVRSSRFQRHIKALFDRTEKKP